MAYTGKTNWQLNEIVKPEDMNRIEQGVIDAHENLLTHKTDTNSHTDIRNKFNEFVKGVTGSNATLTITKGNGTTSLVTVNNVANATKATQDSAGQQINTTYIKGLSVSGKTITYTKGNNTTGTITTQDTVYTHPNSGVSAGTYKSVTVNAQGHVTGGSNPTTLAGYGITDGVFRYALGSTDNQSVYTMFAGCPTDAGMGNISATVLLTQGGDFGGAYQGAWLIQVSTRGGKYMSVKTLRSPSSSLTFGYYVSGSTCYFGALFPAFRGDCNVTVLSNTGCTLKDFGDAAMAPSGWTAVTPELMLDSGNYNRYAPTKTGGGASGTWGINITGNADNATKWNGLVNDLTTENNTDIWIPVLKDNKLQHTTKANMTVGNATKATQDSAGQQINTTYIKGLSISGNTITYTKGNGGTGSITVPTGAGAKGYIVESKYNADGSWYRKWSDGWLEQGGFCNATSISAEITVNLLKPMKNTNYTVLKSFNTTLSSGHGAAFAPIYVQAYAKTTTSFKTYDGNTTLNTVWYACGQSA